MNKVNMDQGVYYPGTSNYPEIQISCVSNMYVRMMEFKKSGCCEPGHAHPFDHLTLLTKGSVQMEVDGIISTFNAPKMIFILKDKVHSITALEDNTLAFCIHPIRNGERIEDIVDPSSIPKTSKDILDHLYTTDILKYVCEQTK